MVNRLAEMAASIVKIESAHIVVWLHTAADPLPSSWSAVCEKVRAYRLAEKLSAQQISSFVVTDGGAPNARQRVELNVDDIMRDSRVACVSNAFDNPIKKGIATAISWANPAFHPFDPRQWEKAVAHVALSSGSIADLLLELDKLQASVRPVKTLGLVRAAASPIAR